MSFEMPIWEKINLSIDEAALYSGIGTKKLYDLTNDEDCSFVLWIGSKRLIKRKKFEEFFDETYEI